MCARARARDFTFILISLRIVPARVVDALLCRSRVLVSRYDALLFNLRPRSHRMRRAGELYIFPSIFRARAFLKGRRTEISRVFRRSPRDRTIFLTVSYCLVYARTIRKPSSVNSVVRLTSLRPYRRTEEASQVPPLGD